MRSTMMERFMAKVDVNPYGCWLWTGGANSTGRGAFYPGKRADGKKGQWLAHRFMYTVARGPIPDGLELDHLCRTPLCVNPWHLEPVTHAENIARIPRNSVCKRGHPFTDENTMKSNGRRYCRECAREWSRQYDIKYPGRRLMLARSWRARHQLESSLERAGR